MKIQNKPSKWLSWSFLAALRGASGPAGAVCMGDYRLIEVFRTGKVEFDNLRDRGDS
jgi:hypothetical protein